jgi:hypothetical protein
VKRARGRLQQAVAANLGTLKEVLEGMGCIYSIAVLTGFPLLRNSAAGSTDRMWEAQKRGDSFQLLPVTFLKPCPRDALHIGARGGAQQDIRRHNRRLRHAHSCPPRVRYFPPALVSCGVDPPREPAGVRVVDLTTFRGRRTIIGHHIRIAQAAPLLVLHVIARRAMVSRLRPRIRGA